MKNAKKFSWGMLLYLPFVICWVAASAASAKLNYSWTEILCIIGFLGSAFFLSMFGKVAPKFEGAKRDSELPPLHVMGGRAVLLLLVLTPTIFSLIATYHSAKNVLGFQIDNKISSATTGLLILLGLVILISIIGLIIGKKFPKSVRKLAGMPEPTSA